MVEYKCIKRTRSGKDFIQCRRWFVNKNGVARKPPPGDDNSMDALFIH
jgi:hypothetical protein